MPGDEGVLEQSEVEALFNTLRSPSASATGLATPQGATSPDTSLHSADQEAQPYRLNEIATSATSPSESPDINLILDVDLNVRVELGRTRMYIEDVLKLREGSIVPLEKLAGDPVDIHVNGRLMARGEVLVLNDNFCVRVSEVLGEVNERGTVDA